MTICSAYPIEIITGELGAIKNFPVPCSPLIEVALYFQFNLFTSGFKDFRG